MEWNRSRFFMIGLLLLLFGVHFRCVNAIVLNKHTTQFLAERMEQMGDDLASTKPSNWLASQGPIANKTITPPTFLGWSLLSVGSVITLHALVMRKQA